MQRSVKIIFWFSIIMLALLFLAPLLAGLMPLEFASNSDKEAFESFRVIGILVCLLLTLSGTLKKDDTGGVVMLKIVGTIVVTGLVLFFMAIAAFGDMCAWYSERILFENKNDRSQKIILRSFGCGATDSTSPTMEVVKATYYTSHFFRLTAIDTTKIDRTIWLPVHNKEE